MKTIPEYLSGQFDEELRVLVMDTLDPGAWPEITHDRTVIISEPFSTSLDACRELLEDLTEMETDDFVIHLSLILFGGPVNSTAWWDLECHEALTLLRATAQQICVAFLIAKGILK